MGVKATVAKPIAKYIAKRINQWSSNALHVQQKIFQELIRSATHTQFGKDHDFGAIQSYDDFTARVPIRDYEGLRHYINRIKDGSPDVLWPGMPKYFAKTSGTTSGVKYIPLTRASVPNHFGTARNALFHYYAQTNNGGWLDGQMIFLSGSPELEKVGTVLTGRLSGIVNHMVPAWLRTNQKPSYETNCIEDWETKLDRIVDETVHADMRLISGIPPWVIMYFERLLARSGKPNIHSLFPNFSVFVYGGVNYEPYRTTIEQLIGKPIDTIETYPASEGFIAFQDQQHHPALLLNVNSGIFFEFVLAQDIFDDNPSRIALKDVELGVNYALIINSNAGLWAYNLGDTIQFVSKNPYRILVTGRIKHFISAFGEHVIGKEVEQALKLTLAECPASVVEFTVAPQVNPPEGGLPYHQWLIEFDKRPDNLAYFSSELDKKMVAQNIYYADLIQGKILQPLKVIPLPKDAFRGYMKSIGKLGGQNKVPRLSNDRKIADALISKASK